MNWLEFETACQDLSKKIDFNPNIIVAITRGGIVPGRLLSSLLRVKEMHCLSVQKADSKRVVTTEIKVPLKNKSLLLVEDMLETGDSLTVAKEYLESLGADVRTCCLYTLPQTGTNPNYYLERLEVPIKFPWE
jgi:hypoxanthine phosphoribosyltransferase